MKRVLLSAAVAAAISVPALAAPKVNDEASLMQAIAEANNNSEKSRIVFRRGAHIQLSAPVIYTGSQPLTLIGNGAIVDGTYAGSFELDEDLTAVTEEGTLVFNTAGDLTIKNLSITNSATRGLVVNIPENAEGHDMTVRLHKVSVTDSALYGVHIDDNADEFDDGTAGSDIGVELIIRNSEFTGNGTGAIDFDGVRVDERGLGDIHAEIINTHIDGNGGDGIELDEGGDGDVDATMINVTLNGNGFYNEEDLDDGFDIDEADAGDLEVTLIKVQINDNMDEGLDFDEAGEGDLNMMLRRVDASNNKDEAIKADEEDAGDLEATLKKVVVNNSGDDGIQLTELGDGEIDAKFNKVISVDNAKYGIKAEQWVVEDEPTPAETAGTIKSRHVYLDGNEKGDELKVNNVVVN